jgi:hypothetical protein
VAVRAQITDVDARVADVLEPSSEGTLEAQPEQPSSGSGRSSRQCLEVRLSVQHVR